MTTLDSNPLLELFKRGEVARDVRMLAALGTLAPRAHEQLAILVLLLDDSDPEVQGTADRTLNDMPAETLGAFLARSDVSDATRELFAQRGVRPAESAGPPDRPDDVEPEDGDDDLPLDDGTRASLTEQLAKMSFTDRLKAAVKGSREMRAVLIRDPNKLIAATVLSSPKVTESEVEGFARMANVTEDVLRIIASNRAWVKHYGVVVGLTKNPKTPLGLSLSLMARLNDRDMQMLSIDRNVPEPLRVAARKRVVEATSKK